MLKLSAQIENVVHLEQGEPDFEFPHVYLQNVHLISLLLAVYET
jgi:hypothetical protein